MANMTPQEQLMLELINRARMNPAGEAKRFDIDLNEGISGSSKISTAPKQVLAGNDKIALAADKHSSWMLAHDVFSHGETKGTSGFTGAGPTDRIKAAGFQLAGSWTTAENIAFSGTTASINSAARTQMIIDQHSDLFIDEGIAGRGHRINILSDKIQEIGIGQKIGVFTSGGNAFNASMVTQDFAKSGNKVFVTGVVYKDKVVQDNFFSVGEQMKNVSVTSSGAVSDKTGEGGGYELLYTAGGNKMVNFALSTGKLTVGLALGSSNVKIDVVNGNEVWANATIKSVSSNVKEVHVLGILKTDLTGADGTQKLFGNGKVNVLKGLGGDDKLTGGGGADDLYGGSGADRFIFKALSDSKVESKGRDTIFDFSHAAGDRIDLSAIDAITSTSKNDAFTFIGTKAFSGKAGELRFVKKSSDTYIYANVDTDKAAEFAIHLDDKVTLVKGDFIL